MFAQHPLYPGPVASLEGVYKCYGNVHANPKGRVIASGTVNEIRSVVARKKISCVTSLEPHDVRHWSGSTASSRRSCRAPARPRS